MSKLITLVVSLFLCACSTEQNKTAAVQEPVNNTLEVKSVQDNISISFKDLIKGKWQHVEDTSNYLIFDGNFRIETSGGNKAKSIEQYTISKQCQNEFDRKEAIVDKEERYISCAKSDLCWYIVSCDNHKLSLSYVGRGNTLDYKKVESED